MKPGYALTFILLGLTAGTARAQTQDLAALVAADPQLSTLAKAVTAADFAETLKRRGPLTLFAPTNAAFAKLPPATLNKLLADKAELRKLLLYHAVPGALLSSKLKPGTVRSVEGRDLTIKTSPAPSVNAARIVQKDVRATNGVLHTLDTVLVPKVIKRKKVLPSMPKPGR